MPIFQRAALVMGNNKGISKNSVYPSLLEKGDGLR
jgi:hypothetical protein